MRGSSGQTTVAFVYFQTVLRQRSIDFAQDVKFAVPMNRLTPYMSGTFLNTKQRPGLDIDLRARRIVIDLLAGLDLRLGGKTTLGGSVSAAKESFAEQTIVEGVSLREQLTRRTETGVVQLTHALTPLTTISVAVEAERQTFSYDPSRDSTSFRIAPRVEFKPSALIHGSATFGYRSVSRRRRSSSRSPVSLRASISRTSSGEPRASPCPASAISSTRIVPRTRTTC